MWLSAEERHKHHQALCRQLQHDCTPCEECNTHVILMLHILHHRPGAKYRKEVFNASCYLTEGKHIILRQKVRGSVIAVRAVRNTRVFLMETRVVADGPSEQFEERVKMTIK